ncbi:hypothetical protein ACPV5S_15730 [Vibrio astriarenae]
MDLDTDISDAFARYRQDMNGAIALGKRLRSEGYENDVVLERLDKEIKTAKGRLGGSIAAAVKRDIREYAFSVLTDKRDEGMDLTVTLVHNIAERSIGRRFSNKEVTREFGTTGRTAADKSLLNEEDLSQFETWFNEQVATYQEQQVRPIKIDHRVRWMNSSDREKIIEQLSELYQRDYVLS